MCVGGLLKRRWVLLPPLACVVHGVVGDSCRESDRCRDGSRSVEHRGDGRNCVPSLLPARVGIGPNGIEDRLALTTDKTVGHVDHDHRRTRPKWYFGRNPQPRISQDLISEWCHANSCLGSQLAQRGKHVAPEGLNQAFLIERRHLEANDIGIDLLDKGAIYLHNRAAIAHYRIAAKHIIAWGSWSAFSLTLHGINGF